MLEGCNSISNALELCLSCTNPSKCYYVLWTSHPPEAFASVIPLWMSEYIAGLVCIRLDGPGLKPAGVVGARVLMLTSYLSPLGPNLPPFWQTTLSNEFSWFNNRATLVQVMAEQATSNYLNLWWPNSSTHKCGTRGKWVNFLTGHFLI